MSREKHEVTLEVLNVMHLVCHTFCTFCTKDLEFNTGSQVADRKDTTHVYCMCPIYVNDTVLIMKLLPLR